MATTWKRIILVTERNYRELKIQSFHQKKKKSVIQGQETSNEVTNQIDHQIWDLKIESSSTKKKKKKSNRIEVVMFMFTKRYRCWRTRHACASYYQRWWCQKRFAWESFSVSFSENPRRNLFLGFSLSFWRRKEMRRTRHETDRDVEEAISVFLLVCAKNSSCLRRVSRLLQL